MAKRKSNRAARRLLARRKCPNSFRISNRRWMVFGSNYPFIWEFAKPSRSQRRAKRLIEEMRIERHFQQNCSDGMSAEQAWDLAVKTVKG
ncbi:Uncharacterised protein [Serratia proteamaculans]|uniref:hypothetical protein n=1 Tax=Serratia proteamaculans TaxID=28151 RepID=UPI00217B121F|nr:hypothetical protein [Serratia proteamaculans]CAI0724082.1 Uncharacterised protein [Serratia proteamaculans]CAI1520227.1 Uncharacterised protein [Serratia proteamaculans]